MRQTDGFEDHLDALDTRLGETASMTAAFGDALSRAGGQLALTNREISSLSSSFGSGLRRAFDGVVFDGVRLSDALRQIGASMSASVYNMAMKPVQNALGGALARGVDSVFSGLLPFADGGVFSQGRVSAFAKGGVVSQPVSFPMRGGRGLMGEAGPEAIMPLVRGADGSLGVRSAGGGRPISVVMNISTPDVQGFQRSQSQIAAQAARALSRGQRNR